MTAESSTVRLMGKVKGAVVKASFKDCIFILWSRRWSRRRVRPSSTLQHVGWMKVLPTHLSLAWREASRVTHPTNIPLAIFNPKYFHLFHKLDSDNVFGCSSQNRRRNGDGLEAVFLVGDPVCVCVRQEWEKCVSSVCVFTLSCLLWSMQQNPSALAHSVTVCPHAVAVCLSPSSFSFFCRFSIDHPDTDLRVVCVRQVKAPTLFPLIFCKIRSCGMPWS